MCKTQAWSLGALQPGVVSGVGVVPCFTGDTHGGLWGAWCCWECLSSKDMVCTGGKNRGPSTNSGAAIRLQTSWTGQEQGHGPRWHRGAKTCVREARPTRALNHPGCHFVTPWASPRLFFFFSLQSDFFFFFYLHGQEISSPMEQEGDLSEATQPKLFSLARTLFPTVASRTRPAWGAAVHFRGADSSAFPSQ